MKLTAIAPWFGSKRTMAPAIVAEFGDHRAYWEPFCGSLAVLLVKPQCGQETACDLHGDLTNLAWVLQGEDTAADLYARMLRTLPAESRYLAAQAECRDDWTGEAPDVDRAYAFLFSNWCGRNGMSGTKRTDSQICVRWTSNGGSPARRFRAVAESIPDWHARLANVLILRRDGMKVLESIEDQEGTAIYADPPYLLSTRKGDRGGGTYRHEFTDGNHERLAALLRRFRKARVVVSYYADPRLAALYPGWIQIDHTRPKHLSVNGRRGATKQEAPEVLLINRPSITTSRAAPEELFS